MKTIPKLFTAPMVRAILQGRKVQTRRLDGLDEINQRPDGYHYEGTNPNGDHLFIDQDAITAGHDPQTCMKIIPASCHIGDVLCVRETWAAPVKYDGLKARDIPAGTFHYLADGPKPDGYGKTRPGIFLPKWAWRIQRPIVAEERMERVAAISEADARAEGVFGPPESEAGWRQYPYESCHLGTARESFQSLWESIHGPDAWTYWVRVLTFSHQ